jgi:hypothetical protein
VPVAERPTEVIRGQETSCLPCSQQEDEPVIDDPERFRNFLDRPIEATPELFPAEIRRGDRRKDSSTSRKTGWKLRRMSTETGSGLPGPPGPAQGRWPRLRR